MNPYYITNGPPTNIGDDNGAKDTEYIILTMLSHRISWAFYSPEPNLLDSILMVSQKTSFINGKIIIIKFYAKYVWERMRIIILAAL